MLIFFPVVRKKIISEVHNSYVSKRYSAKYQAFFLNILIISENKLRLKKRKDNRKYPRLGKARALSFVQ